MEILANLALLALLLVMVVYPKYMFCLRYASGIFFLRDETPRYTVEQHVDMAIPFFNTKSVATSLGMNTFPKVFMINFWILIVAIVLRVLGLIITSPFFMIAIVVVYYFALLLTVVVDAVFVYKMAGMFDHKWARFWCILSPLGYAGLARALPRYFAKEKDFLSGAFDAKEK